ncbi:beta-lactamase [Melanomma pulvis-pyrius CBS 109.77]|uniref:Beta-lactamase n=1 Tax=Melanomma pulvis-pyrius CBS 109.77 TaxID=1314802 RepID=A0A6A6XLB6_9PLEO|nr:beta-lactamase [Melanomma pulvis-pyrius CBS 109.77]
MQYLEDSFQSACANGKIPGAVLAATNKAGSFMYTKAFGFRSLKKGEKSPLHTDAIMTLASCTKLITTIAVLQLVEHGQVSLDDDVAATLPELAKLDILTGVKDGKGVLKKRNNAITLRHLLTHSSGLSYPFMSPLIQEYNKSLGLPAVSHAHRVVEGFSSPLLFEPGTFWTYSCGIDWAGLLVSRVTGMDLETYYQRHIFTPLGINDISFWPDKNPELAARQPTLSIRDTSVEDGSGTVVPFSGPNIVGGAEEEMAGQGLYSSMPSYLKILHSILADDEKLLNSETTAQMFKPQLTVESQAALQDNYKSQPLRGPCSVGNVSPNCIYDWGLGGLLTMEDVNEGMAAWRKKGCLTWGGVLNCFWFLDRKAGICGTYGTQVLPPGDAQTREMMGLFEKSIYQQGERHGNL